MEFERLCEGVRALLGSPPFGLITDVDGTISPLAESPGQAVVTDRNRSNLRSLVDHGVLVAVVSGRSAEQTRAMVGLENVIYFGNHGLERIDGHSVRYPPELGDFPSVVERIINELVPALKAIPGLVIEDKRLGVSIHYRLSPDSAEAKAAILKAIRRVSDFQSVRIREGKMVVEILPLIDITKGNALIETVKNYQLKSVVYLGDDNTDIDAMTALSRLRAKGECGGVSIAVSGEDTPQQLIDNADHGLAGVREVEKFLEWLAIEVSRREAEGPQIGDTTRQ